MSKVTVGSLFVAPCFCRFRALRKGEKDGCHTNPNGILSFSL